MSQNRQIRCQHCHTLVECAGQGEARFWVRCGGCGRPVMPRDWGDIVADPEPAVLFEPPAAAGPGARGGQATMGATPTFAAMRRAVWQSRTARRHLLVLIASAGIVSGVSGGVYSGWYLATDVIFSALVGVGIAAMSLLVPELMIAVAAGSISCWFCYFLFGLYGNEFQTLISYFSYGFIFAVFVQIGRVQVMRLVEKQARFDAEQAAALQMEAAEEPVG